jgi:glutaredoxin
MYKWVDAQGRTQYSDTPPPPSAKKVEEQKIIRNTIDTAGAPYAVQEAAKRNPVTVWMNDCGDLCNRARDFLARRGVPHTLRNPSRQAEQEAWKKASGGDNSVPLLVIGSSQTVKGFDESQWNTALDAAGYPRGAPAVKPQAIPAADAAPAAKPPAAPAAASK